MPCQTGAQLSAGCDERISVEVVIFCCYTIMFEAKLLMEVMGLGSHAVKGEK